MSLSQKNLSSIQKAGQAVHGACEAIAETMRSQAQSLVASVSSQPFGPESEQSIARFKVLARLSQGLVAVEGQLQELYAMANELANPASDVIALPAISKHQASNAAAVDVVAKPAKPTKAGKAAKAVKKQRSGAHHAAAATANDLKLLAFLQGVLKAGEWTAQTGNTMAAGSGLPLGSVGLSLKKLLASGAVKVGARGMYQLGASAAAAGAKKAPAKKARPALAKAAKAAKKVKAAVPKTSNPAPAVAAEPPAQAQDAPL